MKKIRIGMMGLGKIGRQIYKLALRDSRFEIVAISDIGQAKILSHLLNIENGQTGEVRLEGNYLISNGLRTRLLPSANPSEIPWDVFEPDFVIDTTGQFRSLEQLKPHLDSGAKRVITSALPQGDIDRVVLYGVNNDEMHSADRIISAGSASTTATALALKIMSTQFEIAHASVTSVHAYTSEQSLQDRASGDFRRSRSGAQNIIPNITPALHWVQQVFPPIRGKMTAYALNVPVQNGSMLDITVSLAQPLQDPQLIKQLFVEAANAYPSLIGVTEDPIVSSDVIGSPLSLLVDLQGSMQAGSKMFKLLGWHESLGHAHRILDVVSSYASLDDAEQAEGAK